MVRIALLREQMTGAIADCPEGMSPPMARGHESLLGAFRMAEYTSLGLRLALASCFLHISMFGEFLVEAVLLAIAKRRLFSKRGRALFSSSCMSCSSRSL